MQHTHTQTQTFGNADNCFRAMILECNPRNWHSHVRVRRVPWAQISHSLARSQVPAAVYQVSAVRHVNMQREARVASGMQSRWLALHSTPAAEQGLDSPSVAET